VLRTVPVTFTRMCYYSDVVDGDWVFDYSPKYSSLLFATGGAGHAFKVCLSRCHGEC
jgi:sarcosine oxidase/L-pipecolate oxidase